MLDTLYRRYALTAAQTQRFFANMVRFSIVARPIVVRGQEFYVGVELIERGPFYEYLLRARVEAIRIGNRTLYPPPVPWITACSTFSRYTGTGGSTMPLGLTQTRLHRVGCHAVTAVVAFQIDLPHTGKDWVTEGWELYSERRTLTEGIQVLAEEPPDLFKMTHSPELDAVVAAGISVTDFRIGEDEGCESSSNSSAVPEIHGVVRYADPRRIGLAFEALADFEGRRVDLGTITFNTDPLGISGHSLSTPYWGEVPSEFTLILRASKEVGTRTPDLFEIWDGELWFEGVEIVESDPNDSQSLWTRDARFSPQVRPRQPSPQDP